MPHKSNTSHKYGLNLVAKLCVLSVLTLPCSSGAWASVSPAQKDSRSQGHSSPHWGYSGSEGPQYWKNLAAEFAMCGSGKRQSPIDIRGAEQADLYSVDFNYQSMALQVLNNGHTIQANYKTPSTRTVKVGDSTYPLASKDQYDSYMNLGDERYELVQFHFHTPSEHSHNGERYPMEVHMVHKNSQGNLAVVGVFLKMGKHNSTLEKVLENASRNHNELRVLNDVRINAASLLPRDKRYYHYSGSLTTPPCSENVNWIVMKNPIEASSGQVDRFINIIGENARPIQKKHWRNLLITSKQ